MSRIKVRATYTEPSLATRPANQELHSKFIASKAPDARSREEEIAAVGADEVERKEMCIFPRDEQGNPFIWDYQIKGFFKNSCSALQRMKNAPIAKESCGLKAYKKVIDGAMFVFPRKIVYHLPEGQQVTNCERPLRGQTAQGERIALANSEQVPAGTEFSFYVDTDKAFDGVIQEWLRYGALNGIGQWHNSGMGRFRCEIDITDEAFS